MLDLDLVRLAKGHDRSPDGLEGAVWSRVAVLESLRKLLHLTARVQLLALSLALLVSLALGLSIAQDLARPSPSARISAAASDLAPSTLLGSAVP